MGIRSGRNTRHNDIEEDAESHLPRRLGIDALGGQHRNRPATNGGTGRHHAAVLLAGTCRTGMV